MLLNTTRRLIQSSIFLLLILMAYQNNAYCFQTFEGELEVFIEDNFDQKNSKTEHYLKLKGSNQRKLLKNIVGHNFSTGQAVRVTGMPQENDSLIVDSVDVITDSNLINDQNLPALNLRKTIVFIVDLQDVNASNTYSKSLVANRLSEVDNFYRSASFGQIGFNNDVNQDGAPDVYGPFSVPFNSSTCSYYDWAYSVEDQALQAGIDLSQYTHRVFVVPHYSKTACTWSGKANVGCGSYCRTWIANGDKTFVYVHELGHNLSFKHAATDPEDDGSINSSYGDYSDPMGASYNLSLFNSAHIEQHNWMGAYNQSAQEISQSGNFYLYPIVSDPYIYPGPYIYKIARNGSLTEPYYLSFRVAQGIDIPLSSTYTTGVSIHYHSGSVVETKYVTTLKDGETFQANDGSFQITQVLAQSGIVEFDITFGGGGNPTPTPPPEPTTDTEAPSVPTGLSAIVKLKGKGQIQLSWLPSQDNVAVAYYSIYRDGVLIGSSTSEGFNDSNFTVGATYTYSVSATDTSSNESASVSIIVQASDGGGTGGGGTGGGGKGGGGKGGPKK